MKTTCLTLAAALFAAASCLPADEPAPLAQPVNTWVKRSPLPNAPPSPGMGYEASLGYDPIAKKVIRWAGHNQGGGGEQNAETWVYEPATSKWTLMEPNTSPPGVCCAQQNVMDLERNRFIRFASFAGNHGWHWFRENYLSNSSVWSYDLAANTWRDLRPVPTPRMVALRCAAWDSDHQVMVVFGGEGSSEGTLVYDPHANTWTRMQPKTEPPPRSAGNMAYDAHHKLHVLFGTQFSDDPFTWVYDLRANTWTARKPTVQPPTERNDAVLVYDSRNKVVVASVRAIDKSEDKEVTAGHYETWLYDTGKNVWTHARPAQEPPGWGNRRRIMVYLPDQNLTLMENYVNPSQRIPGVEREQQMLTYRAGDGVADPRVPAPKLTLTTEQDAVTLRWQPTGTDNVKGYHIYRGEGSQAWRADCKQIGSVAATQLTYRDTGVKLGTAAFYYVQAHDAADKPGHASMKVRTQPRLVEDVVVAMLSPQEAKLTWPAATSADIVGYHIERAPVEPFTEDQIKRLKKDTTPLAEPSVGGIRAIGTFERLTKEPVAGTSYTDTSLDLRKPAEITGKPAFLHRFSAESLDADGKPYHLGVYAYRVLAVNKLGVVSGPGPYVLTIPSAPKWVFSQEDGKSCKLKWAANPEAKLQGYRVYRMESPRINGPGQKVTRVTAEPLAGTTFTDPAAGDVPRRYWIVAVDALGQEGVPSAPTWHQREYRRFYLPFVGPWHQ